MYKTIWFIDDGEDNIKFIYYHFGREPKFPSWYMQNGITYEIEMVYNLKLSSTLKMFFKCLFHEYTVC